MIENEILVAENVEVDIETLADATSQLGSLARWKIVEAVIEGLDSKDREKLEAYKNQ